MLDAIEQDSQSEKEVRKNFCPANLLTPARKNLSSRFSVDYWRDRLFRPTYQNNGATGEVQEWYAQIQFAGRREKVGLATNNKEEAARVAARFYSTLRGKGWEEALKQLSPDLNRTPKSPVTIGSFIEIVRPLLNVRPRTFEIYAYALRKITREAISIRDTNKSKYDPKSKGWRKTTDLLSLSKLTPNAVAQWKSKVLSEAAQDPVSQQRARRNINSFARCARALFSKKLLKKLAEQKILLPSPLPFDGFEMEPQGSTKYDSKVDARALLIKARTELADSSPEAWKVILLALGAGLRRAEIDGLCWGQVDFTRGEIRVVNHAFFQAKTLDSEGTIYVDSGLMSELKRFHVEDGSKPVVDSELMFRQPKTAALSGDF